MLAELDQITSILSNVCVILITAWMVNKSWQFKSWMVNKSWQFKTWMVNKSWQFKTWMVNKSWQFKKNISYYIKMTQPSVDQLAVAQPDVDQIDQLLLQAVASNDVQAGDAQLDDITNMKEKLIQVVAGGKSRRYLGKLMTMKEIEQLDDEALKKFYARYEATLGGLITNKLKKAYVLRLFTSNTFYLSNFEL